MAAVLAALLLGPAVLALAGEAGDLVMADRGPWLLDPPLSWAMTREGPAAPGFLPIRQGALILRRAAGDAAAAEASGQAAGQDGGSLLAPNIPGSGAAPRSDAAAAAPPSHAPAKADASSIMLEQQTDGRSRMIGPYPASGGDPVVVFFLENVARDVATLTGGSPFYIRNRIKDALFRGGAVERAGGQVTVTLQPFAADPHRAALHGFETLELRFVMAPDADAPIRSMTAATTAPVQVASSQPAAPGTAAPVAAAYRLALVQR